MEGGSWAVVRLLVDRGADFNAKGRKYDNALQAAASKDNEAAVRLLVNRGALLLTASSAIKAVDH